MSIKFALQKVEMAFGDAYIKFFMVKGITYILLLLPLLTSAQLEVTDTMSNKNLVEQLGGEGIDISNVTIDCPTGSNSDAAYGYFDASNANLSIDKGLLMTTGSITDVIGPNQNTGITQLNTTSGDPDLDPIVAPQSTNDVCVVEFDLTPLGDTLTFNYAFGSDEYPEYVCSNFNDVFGFFITGPNPNGAPYNGKNIATIPNTTIPVAINSVNNGQVGSSGSSGNCTSLGYTQYYTDNCNCSGLINPISSPFDTDSSYIEYDGITNGLFVKENVVPCQTYHLKLAIADVSDRAFDSGVFIEAESIESPNADVSSGIAGGGAFQNAVEGCVDGLLTFTLDKPTSDTSIVDYDIGGTATNGTDYATIPDSVVFAPGDTVREIVIDAFLDGKNEPIESVEIYLLSKCSNQPYDTAKVFIQDTVGVSTGQPDSLTICRGENIQFDATGAISYNWTPPDWLSSTTIKDPVAKPDSSITYVVSSQIGNCVAYDSTHIEIAQPGHSTNLQEDTTICPTQSVQLEPDVQPSGNYSYSWSPSKGLSDTSKANPIASPNDSTTYYVEVSDSNCTVTDTIDVNVRASPSIKALASTDTICTGGDVQLSVTVNPPVSNANYSWSPAADLDSASSKSPVASVSNTTDYIVSVANGNCTERDTVTVNTVKAVNLTTGGTDVACNGGNSGAAWVTASSGATPYSYEWGTGATSDTIDSLNAGTYTVTVTDDNGCQNVDSFSVTQPSLLVVDSITTTDVTCYGDSTGSAAVSASGGNGPPFSYKWNTGDTTSSISGLPAGSYQATVTDTNKCSNEATVVIDQPSALQLSTSSEPLSCSNSSDGSATVNVSGGVSPYSYVWNDTASQTTSTAEGLSAGNYNVTVYDQNGCTATTNAFVSNPNSLAFDQLDVVDETCPGAVDGAVFAKANGGTSPYSYVLEDDTSDEGVFKGLNGGEQYRLTAIDDQGCKSDTLVRVAQPDKVVVDFERDQITVGLGQGQRLNPVLIPNDTGGYSYMWEPSIGLSCVDCKQPVANPYQETNYKLTVHDQNGCQYSETIRVDVKNPEVLYAPNAFTPDGNERNDEFKIYGEAINQVHLQIFNRWGELVFETKDPSEGWDGTYKGNDAPTGVYLYNARIQYIDGTTKEKQGSLTLIR